MFIDELDALGKTRGSGLPGGDPENQPETDFEDVDQDGIPELVVSVPDKGPSPPSSVNFQVSIVAAVPLPLQTVRQNAVAIDRALCIGRIVNEPC